MSKNRHFWRFWPKTAFLAVFTRKRPFWAFLGPPRGLFYINPSRRGPAVPAGGPGVPPGWGSPHRGEGRIPSPSGRSLPQALAEARTRPVKRILDNVSAIIKKNNVVKAVLPDVSLKHLYKLRLRPPYGGGGLRPQSLRDGVPPGGNRGAPPRGVDVKQPLARGPGAPRGLGGLSRSPGSPGSPVPRSRRPPPDRSGSLPRGRGPGSPARDRSRGPGNFSPFLKIFSKNGLLGPF